MKIRFCFPFKNIENNFLLKYRIQKIIYFILIQNNFKNNFLLKFEVIGLCNKKFCYNKL